jgi:hypothetical protein
MPNGMLIFSAADDRGDNRLSSTGLLELCGFASLRETFTDGEPARIFTQRREDAKKHRNNQEIA